MHARVERDRCERVARRVEHVPAAGVDSGTHDGVMASYGRSSRLAIALPQARRSLDLFVKEVTPAFETKSGV